MIESLWNHFLMQVTKQNAEMLSNINPPASLEKITNAQHQLGALCHEDITRIYRQTNGFAKNAYLLRDDYRVLPIDEMLEKTLGLVGEYLPTDAEAGESRRLRLPKILIFAVAKDTDPDISQIGFSIRKGKTAIVIWYKERGIHDFEEVVQTSQSLESWLKDILEYYQ